MKASWRKATGVAIGAALVAAACGGDDGGGGSGGAGSTPPVGTVDPGVKAGVAAALGGGSTTTAGGSTTTAPPAGEPSSMQEWEALWAEQRADIVQAIEAAHGGKSADGTTVTGTGGFSIDLTRCAAGWSDTEGLSDTEIKIGHTTAQSGTLADYGNIARMMELMFDEVNNNGGITDSAGVTRKIKLIVKDDGYDPARTIPLVDELIDSEKVFMMWTLGSGNTMKVYDKLNQRCIPQPFSMTGHPAWGDPVNHPWTTGLQLAYNTEAVLWGAFIEERIDEMAPNGGTVKVAGLIMNNEFGNMYSAAFKDYLGQSRLKDRIEFVSETIEPQAPTLTDAMTTLAAKEPDMFIAMIAGAPCTQAITEAANNGMKESVQYLFAPSVCVSNSFVGYDKVGDAVDGWWIVNGGSKDIIAPSFDDDPWIQHGRELLSAAGTDYHASGSFGSGLGFGWPMIEALKIAAELPGGLTRSNLIVAVRALDMTHPNVLAGIEFNMNGNEDAYLIEGGIFQTRIAKEDKWVDETEPIDLSGQAKNCAWDQSANLCR